MSKHLIDTNKNRELASVELNSSFGKHGNAKVPREIPALTKLRTQLTTIDHDIKLLLEANWGHAENGEKPSSESEQLMQALVARKTDICSSMAAIIGANQKKDTRIEQQKEYEQKEKLIEQWVAGNPIHLNIFGNQTCCPDLSCCNISLLAPLPFRKLYRKAFKDGDVETKEMLLKTFSQYMCESQGWSCPSHGMYYTEWVKESDLFSFKDRMRIFLEMKLNGIKY